jgi:hypothetical protein
MTTRFRTFGNVAPWVVALIVALLAPVRATGQAPSRDTAAAAAPVKDLPLTAEQRQVFVGSYAVTLPYGEQTSLRVFEENGVLKAQPENQQVVRLLYQGDNVFQPEGISDFVLRFVVENGRAMGFTVRKEDGLMRGTRIP